jgi:hypothetical protein
MPGPKSRRLLKPYHCSVAHVFKKALSPSRKGGACAPKDVGHRAAFVLHTAISMGLTTATLGDCGSVQPVTTGIPYSILSRSVVG